jgi:hypothetical protein
VEAKMRELYIKVNEILNRIDFNKIWRGFSKFNFALYNETEVYLQDEVIPYDRRFLGNTAIEYNNEYIAIWHVEDPAAEDPETLSADLTHEMFHAFQQKNRESRYPDDLKLLNYPDNTENFLLKYSENQLLARAFISKTKREKIKCLKQFMSARKYRESLIGDIVKQEYLSETIEGMAEFAGITALRQISGDKYKKRINGYIENLKSMDGRFFEIRRMLYHSGALFCILLSEAGLDFYHAVGGVKFPLFSIAAGEINGEKPGVDIDKELVLSEIDKYAFEKKQKFAEFESSHNEKAEKDCYICGYDPMNMIRMGDKLLCVRFVMLKSEADDNPMFIQGPVMVNLKSGSANEVLSYVK